MPAPNHIASLALAAALSFIPAQADMPAVGDPAPDIALTGFRGQPIDIGRERGHVVVLNIWASWCGPCVVEMPLLDAWAKDHAAAGIKVIGLSADKPSSAEAAREIAQGVAFDTGLLADAARNTLGRVNALPQTIVIDAAGVVRAVIVPSDRAMTSADLDAAALAASAPTGDR